MACLKKPRDDGVCYPVFVDCSVPSLLEETETNETVKTTGDETENDKSGPKQKHQEMMTVTRELMVLETLGLVWGLCWECQW